VAVAAAAAAARTTRAHWEVWRTAMVTAAHRKQLQSEQHGRQTAMRQLLERAQQAMLPQVRYPRFQVGKQKRRETPWKRQQDLSG